MKFNRSLDTHARKDMTNLTNNFYRVINQQSMDSTVKKNKINFSKHHYYQYLRLIDFPTHDFAIPVHQYQQSPMYKENRQLRDYQVTSLNWLLRAWHESRNCILADEMGLGKTIQSIAFLTHLFNIYRLRGPYLVIAPLTTLQHWKKTVEDWTMLNCVIYHDQGGSTGRDMCFNYEAYYTDIMKKGTTSQKSKLIKFHIMITSYEVFMQDYEKVFSEIPFQYITIDEAHRLKNKQAKILNLLKALPCRRYLLLTGTPLQNNTEELWTLLNFIEPERFLLLSRFMDEYGTLNSSDQVDRL